MSFNPILLPLVTMVFLTFAVWVYLFAVRLPEISRRDIDPQDLRDRAEAHTILTASAAPSNNLKNLFEMPVLFYIAALVAMLLMIQDSLLVGLAWGFVTLRVIHSVIQCSYNRVTHRFAVYMLSNIFLILMWLRLASYILMN